MIVKELKELLSQNADMGLSVLILISDSKYEYVPSHFHVTQIGRSEQEFIDCGGMLHSNTTCVLQIWVANDDHHRLNSTKLLKIFPLADALDLDNLAVEVEYGSEIKSQFVLEDVEITAEGLLFLLSGIKTDCLALDKCGIKPCCGSSCC